MQFRRALEIGFERLAAWSDLLDAINVFPVADGDTGRNLQISLMPLKVAPGREAAGDLATALLRAARGNSGNIAARFFDPFVQTAPVDLPVAARRGAEAAAAAVPTPIDGTMLTLFARLANHLEQGDPPASPPDVDALLASLADTVRESRDTLPRLKTAGVVDAGALGMFLFFEGFFFALVDSIEACRPPTRRFQDGLRVRAGFREDGDAAYCIDTVVEAGADVARVLQQLPGAAGSVVSVARGAMLKLHLHTDDREGVRRSLEAAGRLVSWSEDDLADQVRAFHDRPRNTRIHIATDGAASLTRADQTRYGFTLLDSYIVTAEAALPESRVAAGDLYRRLRSGERVSTSQASDFERHEHYQRWLESYPETLYLCVGSIFTGNYALASAWQARHDEAGRLRVIDTGAASGRLAVMVLAAVRQAARGADRKTLEALTEWSLSACREYIFIDRLKYLAAGGRLSRSGAFFGDLLHVKPVISPLPTGAEKVGSAKNRRGQLDFAMRRLEADLAGAERPLILLEYTDNRDWVAAEPAERLQRRFPQAEILLQPLSLTTGVHTGPGTWAVAIHPDPEGRQTASADHRSDARTDDRQPDEL